MLSMEPRTESLSDPLASDALALGADDSLELPSEDFTSDGVPV